MLQMNCKKTPKHQTNQKNPTKSPKQKKIIHKTPELYCIISFLYPYLEASLSLLFTADESSLPKWNGKSSLLHSVYISHM